ncbi:Holliday junction resolvase RuvX [Dolosigranulum pigrum]|jgi:RNAse H domain protein, YqgF family|uniref:Holliday junction resolvase RuvX n=1 Tax=Dolosigranulum pigrum TaxID=29394 RepID=UPI000DC01C99|nr:Holliday junction resolvase RuvX [Dolosigranulum pigrum]QJS96042.1 Holliday junction resolvase RuvX [Dolosigranulum pigrum]QJS97120.1 Holliday junction resolvase RuvX [Dolosigranulum pigrum]QJS98699.1 Holliday junction resolvase RuvX [Dolosigranulum pigrum]QTJ50527.1 Holliday junction resolvase RuvX [Dolosigranulum pigrum]QTJ57429.1 Holliday junction resolvase RuvX [Dolosigranulum pigrum]
MRLMGLDVGSKTVGVAVSDLLGWTAQGVEVIPINEAKDQFGLERLTELVQEYQVDGFVLGLPKNMDGSIGPRAEAAQMYGEKLTVRFGLPVYFQDERLTTMQVNRMMIEEGNVSRAKRKQVVDKLAAVIILQTYMDRNT